MLFIARSSAEYLTARQMTRFEFYFGLYYPRILLLFTLVVTFSISSPLIAPIGLCFKYTQIYIYSVLWMIGLFYMITKHLLDRYLIFHVYLPTKISQRIHSKAIVYVYVSLLFLLIQVYTHLSSMDYNTHSLIVGIALSLHFFFTLCEFIIDFITFL